MRVKWRVINRNLDPVVHVDPRREETGLCKNLVSFSYQSHLHSLHPRPYPFISFHFTEEHLSINFNFNSSAALFFSLPSFLPSFLSSLFFSLSLSLSFERNSRRRDPRGGGSVSETSRGNGDAPRNMHYEVTITLCSREPRVCKCNGEEEATWTVRIKMLAQLWLVGRCVPTAELQPPTHTHAQTPSQDRHLDGYYRVPVSRCVAQGASCLFSSA